MSKTKYLFGISNKLAQTPEPETMKHEALLDASASPASQEHWKQQWDGSPELQALVEQPCYVGPAGFLCNHCHITSLVSLAMQLTACRDRQVVTGLQQMTELP